MIKAWYEDISRGDLPRPNQAAKQRAAPAYMFDFSRYLELQAELAEESGAIERSRAGLCPGLRLLLITKYQSPADILNAWELCSQTKTALCSQTKTELCSQAKSRPWNIGESYLQSALERQALFPPGQAAPELELIGPLQSKKAPKAAQVFCAIHSIASTRTVHALQHAFQRALEEQTPQQQGLQQESHKIGIYLQYNCSGEAQKNGCQSYEELQNVVDAVQAVAQLQLRGLMTMGAAGAGELLTRRCFARCREDGLRLWREQGLSGLELSMGMSHDYRWALAEGASVLRIGSLLFPNAV